MFSTEKGGQMSERTLDIPLFDADNHLYETREEPAPRVELMDEQGIDRCLLFPTLASLVEERLRDSPDLIHTVVRALDEWLYERWQFDYEGRIFTTPVITLPVVDKVIEELEWVLENPVEVFKRNISISPFWEEDLAGLDDESVRKIMGGNLARLMNVEDAVLR